MDFLWYWPFARSEELALAAACARPDDHIVVQTIDRREAPSAGSQGSVTVVRDLPDVERRSMARATWAVSRAGTYRRRAQARRRMVGSRSFDLVHLHYLNRFSDAMSRFPRPMVMSVHDVMPHQLRLGSYGEGRLLRTVYGKADALVVHHQNLADQLVLQFGIDPHVIHVVPHQVFPVEAFDLSQPAGPPTFLFFGALRPNKGLEVLDTALRLLPDLDIRVIIAGRGATDVETRAASMADRDRRVHAELGPVTLQRKNELFGLASVVVLPYTSFSSQSGVLHDAYGHRRPVIVSDVGALGETVLEDGTGLVVGPRDGTALADAMESALDPIAWRRWVDACNIVAHERSPGVLGVRLRGVYDKVLNGEQPRPHHTS